MRRQTEPPVLLGVHWGGAVTTFTVFSAHAAAVSLSFFDHPESAAESRRIPLLRASGDIWRVDVPDVRPGQLYGYRVQGPYEPHSGHRFNPAKLLVDPWARAITGEPTAGEPAAGDPAAGDPAAGDPAAGDPAFDGFDPDLSYDGRDSAGAMPKCVLVDPAFDWEGDRRPQRPWHETLIYECHVKGLTMRHPEVEPRFRGTYLGLAAPPIVEHLQSLGVTAVELLPVHQIAREAPLSRRGLANYWGYSTLGYFAPHAGYATGSRGEQVAEFKTLVKELHRAGLEVILDVVFNHTAEYDHQGPTISLRGLDNRSYYRLRRRNRRRYVNWTGCGNTLDTSREPGQNLVLASLRYWAEEMHVDGFRFDLATTLGRGERNFDPDAELLRRITSDPVLSRCKLIAEPWDLGPDGYQLGRFPNDWAEWNDRYRDAVRRFWRGTGGGPDLAERIAGSRDLFGQRGPLASVVYVTGHDGFTLRDLTSYESKHNESNGEENRDGFDHNLSRNWGTEGETSDPAILAARERARRSLLATVLFSQGVPMLGHGDEIGRTQRGNNNAYCQDNETSWVDWEPRESDRAFLGFVRRLAELRRRHPALRQETFPACRRFGGDGRELVDGSGDHAFALLVPGDDEDLLLLLNGGEGTAVAFELPEGAWEGLLDTAAPEADGLGSSAIGEGPVTVEPYALRLLRCIRHV